MNQIKVFSSFSLLGRYEILRLITLVTFYQSGNLIFHVLLNKKILSTCRSQYKMMFLWSSETHIGGIRPIQYFFFVAILQIYSPVECCRDEIEYREKGAHRSGKCMKWIQHGQSFVNRQPWAWQAQFRLRAM